MDTFGLAEKGPSNAKTPTSLPAERFDYGYTFCFHLFFRREERPATTASAARFIASQMRSFAFTVCCSLRDVASYLVAQSRWRDARDPVGRPPYCQLASFGTSASR